ncbi:MAG: S41 family peptidase [Chthoniobacterales bacterium]
MKIRKFLPVLIFFPSVLAAVAQDVRPAQPVPVEAAQPVEATPTPTPEPTPEPTPVPTPPPLRDMVDGLSESQTEQAISALRSDFLDPSDTEDKSIRRATLEGLVRRLSPGAFITTEEAAARTAEPGEFLAEILDARIGYVRLGGLDSESLAQMDSAIENFATNNLNALILDLRDTPPSQDFDVAADFARRFSPKGKLLFSIQKPSVKQERILTANQDPTFDGVLVVLTDRNTAGAAEALAATLRLNAKAMVIGDVTSGEAVEFEDVPLGDGKILRVAVAQVVLPEVGPIFPAGLQPDILAALTPERQAEIFRLSREQGVSQFVFENERPHLNEAALVANTNPEIDPALANRKHQENWDSVLQRAVDLVTAISFYSGRQQ